MGAPNKKDCFTRLQTAKHSENHRRSLGSSQPYYVIENLPINHPINIWILQHLHHQCSRDSYSEAAAHPKPSIKNCLENSKVSLHRWYAWLQRNLACEGPPFQFRPSETKRHGNPVPYHSPSDPRIYGHQAHQGKRVNFRYSQLLVRMSPWNLHRLDWERHITHTHTEMKWNAMLCHELPKTCTCLVVVNHHHHHHLSPFPYLTLFYSFPFTSLENFQLSLSPVICNKQSCLRRGASLFM